MDERVALLQEVSFCADLPPGALAALAAIAVPLQRRVGATLQLEGDPAEAMYVVIRGRVKVARLAARGREQVLMVLGPGQHFNAVPIFDGGTCPANVEALTDVELLALPVGPLRRVVAEQPALALALLGEFTGRLRYMVNLVDELALHSVQGRVAQLLLDQAVRAERGERVDALTQAEMAAQIGTVREMVARTLKGFEVQGLIRIERGTITVLDRAGLVAQHDE
jgi:CRP/FNR family transcriptional regulator, cyclic AMP receptor protein